MNVHFICRGNVLRSLIAETYLRSLQLPNITATSSGTNVDLTSKTEREFFARTITVLQQHGIEAYAKDTSHQLTQPRTDGQDITVCMNQRVIDEANAIITLPDTTLNWGIIDIGEGHRTAPENTRQYEVDIFQEIVARVDTLATVLSHIKP